MTDDQPSPAAAQLLRERLSAEGVDITDGVAVGEHLAAQAGMTAQTLSELVARDLGSAETGRPIRASAPATPPPTPTGCTR